MALAGGFALYLMDQLGTAVERAISDILPQTLVAMRLSEHSALLAASAPSLTNARNSREIHEVGAGLDLLKNKIDSNVSILEKTSKSNRLEQVRRNVSILADTLLKLKGATNLRINLDEQRFLALTHIREVHSEFSDTVSPVVWGVSSLIRLYGKRVARNNVAALKALRDQHVRNLAVLMELQLAYRELVKPAKSGSRTSHTLNWKSFVEAWENTLTLVEASERTKDPFAQQLLDAGEKFRSTRPRHQGTAKTKRDLKFEAVLEQAIERAHDTVAEQFSKAIQMTQSSIASFVDQSVKDMEYALDIKAEGNLLFALLTAAAEADSRESVSALQDRFKRSRATFLVSSGEFLNSQLSLRNPILAGNVKGIEAQLHTFGDGPGNLFDIRLAQLAAFTEIAQLLAINRDIAAQLNQQVEQLVEEVQLQATGLGNQLERSRGANRALLVLVFLIGLVLLLAIAFFSINTLGKQDRDIRQAAMVFESTSEGIIITDQKARIVGVNQAFEESFEYEKNELIGRHVRVLRSNHHRKDFYKEMVETLSQNGQWQGEIYIREKSGNSHPEWLIINAIRDSRGNLNRYVAIFSDVAIVKRSLQQLDHLAHHDTLTGLPNRLLLQDRLDHAIRRAHRESRQLALLFLDVDRFKNINDTLGHTVGDHLLRLFATRLSDQVREGDTVARLGGDEFMILLEDYLVAEDAHIVANKVLNSLDQAFDVQGQKLYISTSIGISLYPDNGTTVEKLVRNSDAAMYRAKEKGRNNYQFYTSELTAVARTKLHLESSLRTALERDELVLHYQPRWNTTTGKITGVEALLRWQHPERGLIGPSDFLTTLEDSGLMLPAGKWLLRTACEQAQAWQELGLPAIQMSINLSAQQIVEHRLLETITDSIDSSRLDPRYLELELTESSIMKQPDEVIALLNSLHTMGVSFAIDDFGTGHSSLSYLKQLPVQKLKIDRSFVRDIPADTDGMAITSAIIALGHRLKMSIVAEGVETEEQLSFLIEEGCEEAQGYLFSKPIPESELRPLLQNGCYLPTRTTITPNA